jgi:hypothetical protein
MGQAIGSSLPLAVGVALSPIPIIAVVLMLTTPRARVNGPAFVVGWLLGLGVVGTVALLLAGQAGAAGTGEPATWVSWTKIILGTLLLLVAVRQFGSRPKGGQEPAMPAWMSTVERTSPPAALGLGTLLSGVNPKNLLLASVRPPRSPQQGFRAASRPSPTWCSPSSGLSAWAHRSASTSSWGLVPRRSSRG